MGSSKHLMWSLGWILAFSMVAGATDWPQWRGPFFDGSTDEQGVAASWDAKDGIAWASPLPGPSGATPVISKGRVFVTSVVKGAPEFVALCFDAATGKPLWQKTVGSDSRKFPRNNLASPSPAADGSRVFFLYGDGTLVAFDYEGKELWSRNIEKEYGNLAIQFGYSSSPLLYDGRLYITVLRRDKPYRDPPAAEPLDSFILVLDPNTVQNLWKQTRKTNAFDEGMETYSTPVPFVRNGKAELLFTGGDFVTAHDPATGQELWRIETWTEKVRDSRVIPSLVTGQGLVFGCRHKHEGLFAVQPPTDGGEAAKIVWEFTDAAPDAGTPLFYDGRLYAFDGLKRKTMTCLDPKTGKAFWQGKLPGEGPWWSSPTGADGKIYVISEAGDIVVLQAGGDEFKVLFETQIKEPEIQASIAVSGGRLFVRTAKNLYCIGK
ncbi:MAG: PQQ-binding-like beta-propeller repeat protein [Solirubrobacterales bacterium]